MDFGQFGSHRTNSDGLQTICRPCHAKYQRKWRANNPLREQAIVARYRHEHREEINLQRRRKQRERKEDVIDHLGGECACCHENRVMFLAVDHINGGGNRHLQEIGSGALYITVQREGYDSTKYRVLCHNCNNALGSYGFCPHDLRLEIPMKVAL